MAEGNRKANPIDAHIGNRMRMKRKMVGLTQEELGERLGVSFQQIQKYERASNRIGAGRLWEIANALSVPVQYFYDGLSSSPGFAEDPGTAFVTDFLSTAEGAQLTKSFANIPDPVVRKRILELVRTLGKDG